MMPKRWRLIAAIVAAVVVLFLRFWGLPLAIVATFDIAAMTYGASLFFSPTLSPVRRFSTAYLAVVGVSYFIPGLFGLEPYGGLVEAALWHNLISPYLLISVLDGATLHAQTPISERPYYLLPGDGFDPYGNHYPFSGLVVAVSIIAVIAAFAMAKSRIAGYIIWFGLLCLTTVSLAGYIIVARVSWGFDSIISQVCLELSYIAAFALAFKGVDFSHRGRLSDIEEW